MSKNVTPYTDSDLSKKEQVTLMFDRIAQKYNTLNRVLSLGLDKIWRKRLIKLVREQKAVDVLDVATGTGDIAIALSKIPNLKIDAADLSIKMLEVQSKQLEKLKLKGRIKLHVADAEKLPFDQKFDAVTVAFGIRNFDNLEKGLAEMYRVLQPNGCLYVLETSTPKKFPMRQAHYIMSRILIPSMGRLFAEDKGAYAYLGESAANFADGEEMCNKLREIGFYKVTHKPLTGGVVTLYNAQK
ncbi:MAG: bifunctional demethylmenaquinone methyltransferase/2-methoxy-6-polyprenyl-1,4-benzoquinol methylase UbiE [Flavobacteriaceae bacterium]|nr:bifunctional demethylmenaquinone methyltransferase/2-methoxy-6-polyprenyl-1,4-benzoquinol methylase UbiE [Flavobacteriaceae bacterium]